MTDTSTTDTTTTETDTTTTETTDTAAPDLTAELEKWKAQARKHEDRAKANAKAVTELEQLKQSTMTDQEKAVDAAKIASRAEVLAEFAVERVADKVRVAAAGRIAADKLDDLLEVTNLAAFLTADGETDAAKVAKFVDDIAPAPTDETNGATSFVDLGQGARGSNQNAALNGDPLLKDLKAKLGIR